MLKLDFTLQMRSHHQHHEKVHILIGKTVQKRLKDQKIMHISTPKVGRKPFLLAVNKLICIILHQNAYAVKKPIISRFAIE